MILHPFVQLIKLAAAVACVEIRLHAYGGVGQDLNKHRGSVAVAHDGLAQLLDAVVDVHALSHGRRVQRWRHVVPLVIVAPRVLPQVVEAVQLVEHHDACGVTPTLLFRELLELLGLTPRVELLDLVLVDADFPHCEVETSWLDELKTGHSTLSIPKTYSATSLSMSPPAPLLGDREIRSCVQTCCQS